MKFKRHNMDFSEKNYEKLIDDLNNVLPELDFEANFNGRIMSLSVPATTTVKVQHLLAMVPKYRIILRNSAGVILSDTDELWTSNHFYIRNNGAVATNVTVLLLG